MESASQALFEGVAHRDYDSLTRLFATNARNAVVSFVSMRQRWASREPRSEEKMDEFLQQLAYQHEESTSTAGGFFSRSSKSEDESYYRLLRELAVFLAEQNQETQTAEQPSKRKKVEISDDAERLLRDATAILADTRPPADFVVYEDGGVVSSNSGSSDQQPPPSGPPIFDGSVANATPPPLGGAGAGASGGSGTILHLACALDVPLALAFLLAMGSDARACHTAFRRLMIHEAACNGSIKCLTLLLEMGQRYSETKESEADAKMPPRVHRSLGREFDLPFLPRRYDRMEAISPFSMYSTERSGIFAERQTSEKSDKSMDYLSMLRLFKELVAEVKKGNMSELDAARKVLENSSLSDLSKASLARSCAFNGSEPASPRSFMRPYGGSSDGHGNTPLHWAAFKNETECVSLLLQYHADPNSRAHPSGWTPLHDAAYSNSKECIELLIDAGAQVDARANSGATPLCFAAQEDSAEAAALLLKRGADLSTRCAGGPVRGDDGQATTAAGNIHPHSRFSGYTPLHYCAHYNAHRAARVILSHPSSKAAMEIPDLSDRLPIHVAVARGSADVLRELLHAGARVETRSRRSRSRDGHSRRRFNSVRRESGQALSAPSSPASLPREPPSPENPTTPRHRSRSHSGRSTPVSSPLLRSMIPSQPVTSSKPWNCLTQRSIDECRELISEAEKNWTPNRHSLFTPADRQAVMELLRVGKRLEKNGTGIFIDLWPEVLSFCGRGWFEVEGSESSSFDEDVVLEDAHAAENDRLSLPTF